MDTLSAYLPEAKGYLPYYLLTLSIISVGNSLQNYLTLHYSRRLYNGQFVPNSRLPARSETYNPEDATNKLVSAPSQAESKSTTKATDQVTPLAARLFGTWTFMASIIRLYASYNLHSAPVYQLAIWSYIIAFYHFTSEVFYYRSARLGVPTAFPLVLATIGVAWTTSQYHFYVEG